MVAAGLRHELVRLAGESEDSFLGYPTPYLPVRFLKGPYKRGLFPGGFPKGDGEKHQNKHVSQTGIFGHPSGPKGNRHAIPGDRWRILYIPKSKKTPMAWLGQMKHQRNFMCNLEGEPSFPVRFGDVAPGLALGLSRSCQPCSARGFCG